MLRLLLIFLVVFVVPSEVLAKFLETPEGVYSGSVRRDVPNGEGVMKFYNGDVYEGEWRRGRAHGDGKLTKNDGAYREGAWEEGKFHGWGWFVTSSGKKTYGNWTDGLRDGRMYVSLSNGDEYTSLWEFGKLIGNVSYVFVNGDEYDGPLENGKPHGYGNYKDSQTNTEFEGIFKAGEKHGSGVLLWPDDSQWEGSWLGDEPTGLGVHTDASGEKYNGLYGELKPEAITLRESVSSKEVASKSAPSKNVTPSCDQYAFDLVIMKDSAWNKLNFSKKSGTSYCLE